jgi:4-diphosphocytidyl-2-C-methyl-D-erythritol kinase
MIVFPNAKINIGLSITEKRPDGFHNLESLFYPVGLSDILEVLENPNTGKDKFSSSGITIPGNAEENIILKTFSFLREKNSIPPLKIHLHKIIPIGAGLGGGSADAAFFIKVANQMFSLNFSEEEMINVARRAGSDCAFFIPNKPAFALEKGDVLSLAELNLSEYYLLVLNPGIHVSTAEAYKGVVPERRSKSLYETFSGCSIYDWKEYITNDFEKSIFPKYPLLAELKGKLYKSGAIYASMSGSGSSIYGIFEQKPEPAEDIIPYIIYSGSL